mmetsp:Transcript_15181/g.21794  ORF Transcript_15181/g.21794 Transcript_15181/m.21794 type:complete len:112 (-) Transcript_15181:1455-1790(-)
MTKKIQVLGKKYLVNVRLKLPEKNQPNKNSIPTHKRKHPRTKFRESAVDMFQWHRPTWGLVTPAGFFNARRILRSKYAPKMNLFLVTYQRIGHMHTNTFISMTNKLYFYVL